MTQHENNKAAILKWRINRSTSKPPGRNQEPFYLFLEIKDLDFY